jgi:hydroxymethylpyrimidine/phosphomethylpyrimidine kinase
MSPSPDTAVLTIAGSDSSAGAGLFRDQRVLLDHGATARVVVTAVTAQGGSAVTAEHHVPAPIILAQIQAAADEGCLGAVKIGMLGIEETVAAVALGLQMLPSLPIVLDPVLRSSSGTRLLSEGGQRKLLELLCPLVTLLTPNLEEAALLLRKPLAITEQDVIAQASELRDSLSCAVLIKGGHAADEQAMDYLANGGRPLGISGTRIATTMRGTGCALSTAIAVRLARSSELADACRDGKRYVESLLAAQALSADEMS